MIAVDTNMLMYAHHQAHGKMAQARALLGGLMAQTNPWAIPWPCIHEFFAVMTNPRVAAIAVPTTTVIAQIDALMDVPNLRLIGESTVHWATLRSLITTGSVQGGMVHDARIAAICLQHGVRELWTADRDFRRFPKLQCRNPLLETK